MTIDTQFLRHVLPDVRKGRYVFYITIDPKQPGKPPSHTACRSIDELARYAEKNLHLNAYFTPFVFSKGRRKQENTVACRSLFVDIDVGKDKSYATIQQAGAALVTFLDKTKFPPPTVILQSGSGLHCYWSFDKELNPAQWQPAADAFKKFCLDNALHIDPVVTADSARMLRIPGTLNFKHGKAPVKVLRTTPRIPVRRVLDKLGAAPASGSSMQVPDYMLGTDVHDPQIGQITNYPAAMAAHMVRNCQLLAEVARTGGEHCAEPLWRSVLYLLAFCDDGADFVHPLSENHPKYVKHETDAKFQRCLEAKRAKGPGPTLCTTLERAHGGSPCEGCVYRKRINSPISLGAPQAEPGQPPKRFPVERGSITYATESGNRHLCSLFDLTVEEYVGDTPTTILVMRFPNMPPQTIDYSRIHDIGVLRHHVGSSLSLAKKHMAIFDELISSWVRELRETANGFLSTPARIGWSKNWTSFTFTDRILKRDEHKTITSQDLHGVSLLPSMKSVRAMHKAGSYTRWQQHVQHIVDTGIPETHVIMAQSFAAALTELVSDPPAVTILVSDHSGAGKTTMFRAANSAWFAKERGIAMRDTENYINNTIMSSHSVPIFWDELQIQSALQRERDKKLEEVSSIVFRVLQGMDKGRMDSSATIRDKAVNRPMVVISSNMPLADLLAEHHVGAPEAMAARTLQLIATGSPTGNLQGMPLDDNYGTAGEEFVRALMALGRDNAQRLVNVIDMRLMNTPLKKLLEGAGRMWRANLVLTVTAACLVNKFRILKLDVGTIVRVMGAAVQSTQQSTRKASVRKDAIASLFEIIHTAQAYGEIVVTKDPPKPGPQTKDHTFVELPTNRLQLWLAPSHGWGRIRKTVLENALRNHGLVPQRAVDLLRKRQLVVARRNVTYDPRQDAQAMRGPCFDIDLDALNRIMKNRPT